MKLIPTYTEAKRIVGRDGYVEVAKAYYMAPPKFIGRTLWVRSDGWQARTIASCELSDPSQPRRCSEPTAVLDHCAKGESDVIFFFLIALDS